MMVVVHFQEIALIIAAVAMSLTGNAILVARFTIAYPAAIGELRVAAGNVCKYRGIGLSRRRPHAKRQSNGQQSCPCPKTRHKRFRLHSHRHFPGDVAQPLSFSNNLAIGVPMFEPCSNFSVKLFSDVKLTSISSQGRIGAVKAPS